MAAKNELRNTLLAPFLKGGLRLMSRSRLPQTRGNLKLSGLSGTVEVLRDRWGIPHIYAQNAADALFAQGFVHAQDRLWQMDFTRRVVSGRLAEVLGPAALPFDRALRTLGLRRAAQQDAAILADPIRLLVEAYCRGANAWIAQAIARHKLPVEFTLLGYQPAPWEPVDIASWVKLMSWDLAANWQAELTRLQLVQRLGAEKTAQIEVGFEQAWAVIMDAGLGLAGAASPDATRRFTPPRAGEGAGSNNWVVHGARTASGKPLLANDMHLGLTNPAIWYENHLVGGELEVSGVSLPGAPLVVAGHNRSVAWGYTDGMGDAQDLYEETLRQTPDGWEYQFCGEWLAAEVRREEIHVKGKPPVVEEVVVTRHGPVINSLFKDAYPDLPPLALRWTSLDPERQMEAIYAMNTAGSCAEFHQALRLFTSPAQNTVYADTQGNIAYTLSGKLPIRAQGDGSLPNPGWTGEAEWVGWIPFEEMPHLENPSRGFIATANNPVLRSLSEHMIGRDYLQSDRAARISEMLAANERVDSAYFQQMHYDQVSWSARALAAALGELQSPDVELSGIIAQMRTWDGTLAGESPLALIFEATQRQAVSLILDHHLGDFGRRAQGKGPFAGFWGEHCWEWFTRLLERPDSPWFDLGRGEQRDEILLRALGLAVAALKASEGPDPAQWRWDKRHRLTFGHVLGSQKPLDAAFNLGPYPLGGDGTTINATHSHLHDLEYNTIVGPPFRFIADLNDLDHCLGLLVPGQSANLASRHYQDGIRAWFEGQYHPMLFRHDEVEQNLEDRLVLHPQ